MNYMTNPINVGSGDTIAECKCCTLCGVEKSISQFHRKGEGRRTARCAECLSVTQKTNYRKQHPQRERMRYEIDGPEGQKWCPYCEQWKMLDDFAKSRQLAHGRACYCRSCDADKHLQRTFGMTRIEYRQLLASQDGRCAICGATEPGGRFNKSFHVDHNHRTGGVRGLLCARCNTSLGKFEDSPELLRKAANYLEMQQ